MQRKWDIDIRPNLDEMSKNSASYQGVLYFEIEKSNDLITLDIFQKADWKQIIVIQIQLKTESEHVLVCKKG